MLQRGAPGTLPCVSMNVVRTARLVLSVLLCGAALRGQPTASPAPLSEAAPAAPGGWIVREERARRSLEAGFPATAAIIYRQILTDHAPPPEAQQRQTLALVTALLDAGQTREADTLLQDYEWPRTSAYQLRAGLLAAGTRRMVQARAALAAIRREELPEGDIAWWHYLQALVADADNNPDQRRAAFDEAERAALSELQRVRFQLARELTILRAEQSGEQQLATLRSNMERFAGQPTGYDATRYYAAALSIAGRKAEALAVLQRALSVLPATERRAGDEFRLLLGFIAGGQSEVGRRAFLELMRNALRPETGRIALQQLAGSAAAREGRTRLVNDLTPLVNQSPAHPIIEDLLVARARLELDNELYREAEDDARRLLEQFPGSPLRAAALGVRLSVAWEQKRYRTVADIVVSLRAQPLDVRERSELGVLLAEAFFRAGMQSGNPGDYRNAADAYEAALREAPAVVPAGPLIFQRVLAEIRADRLDTAATLLDEAAGNPAFEATIRWQAEWNLAKELQVRNQGTAALGRVEKLLAEPGPGVPPELRIRLTWLQAKLSYDNGRLAEALEQADRLLALLPGAAELPAADRTNVTGQTLLLKAQALLDLDRDEEGVAVLAKLRAEQRGTPAAVFSYIVQAARLTRRSELAQAQKILTDLADSIESIIAGGATADLGRTDELRGYATLALYEAAFNAERQGLDRNLTEANNLLERIKEKYPQSDLRFYAMLKQGDLLRKLNDFAAARQTYEEILINYAQHPDVLLAQLALADTLFALGANNVVNQESAAALFERLRDLPNAPVDLRAEAGFKWGYALKNRGLAVRAVPVLWSVVDAFLLDAGNAAQLGATGRYWVAKSLLELGQLHEEAGRLDEAQRAYRLILERRLGPAAQAQAKLDRYRAAPAEAKQ